MFSRFKTLENFGEEELEKLKDSKVAVVGLGATGSVIADHLARHGVQLVVFDRDYLEAKDTYSSNLYTPEDTEKSVPKAAAAEEKLSQFTEVEAHVENLDGENIRKLEDVDLIMDGTDNLETRFLINEFSKKENIPWIYTAALGEDGYSMLFEENCFSCVFEEVPAGTLDTCETSGIMREVSSITASRSAWKAVRYLCGKEVEEELETVSGESFGVESNGCDVCEEGEYEHLERGKRTGSVCGENKYQVEKEMGEEAFDRLRDSGEVVAENEYLLRVVVDDREFVLFSSGRAIIEARDPGHAEALFSEVLGI